MKLFVMQSPPASRLFLPLSFKYSHHPVLKHSLIYVIPLVWRTKSHIHTRQRVKLWFLYTLIFMFLERWR
jgi:hypothetical protein